MSRKKWTAKEEVSNEDLAFREKRKWQIALRRYILEGKPATAYAPYFGLDMTTFKKWIEAQFTDQCSWENFGTTWQIDHVLPVSLFDLESDTDLRLCWSFANIRVTSIQEGNPPNLLQAKAYFHWCLEVSGLEVYQNLINRIAQMERPPEPEAAVESFLHNNKDYIAALSELDSYDYSRLNQGDELSDVVEEKKKLKNLGL